MSTNKRLIYIGGIAEEVDRNMIHAAFVPFGDIVEINMPLDYETQKHKGFCFLQFETIDDAADAIDNMHNAELYGRTISVNVAKPMKSGSKAIWDDEMWLQQNTIASQKVVEQQEIEGKKDDINDGSKDESQSTEDQTTTTTQMVKSGIQIETIKAGDGKTFPRKGQTVVVHYTGTLMNGKKFDSSRDRGDPFKFKLGKGEVIKGWDDGVAQLSIGQRVKLICSPDYAYGSRGSPPQIPPNATLVFDVQLLKIIS